MVLVLQLVIFYIINESVIYLLSAKLINWSKMSDISRNALISQVAVDRISADTISCRCNIYAALFQPQQILTQLLVPRKSLASCYIDIIMITVNFMQWSIQILHLRKNSIGPELVSPDTLS